MRGFSEPSGAGLTSGLSGKWTRSEQACPPPQPSSCPALGRVSASLLEPGPAGGVARVPSCHAGWPRGFTPSSDPVSGAQTSSGHGPGIGLPPCPGPENEGHRAPEDSAGAQGCTLPLGASLGVLNWAQHWHRRPLPCPLAHAPGGFGPARPAHVGDSDASPRLAGQHRPPEVRVAAT